MAEPVALNHFRVSEERFRLFIESVKDYAIFMLDPEGRVASWNPGAERLKQYKANEIIGQHFSKFYPPEDLAAGKPDRELKEAIVNGRVEDEGWRLRRDGSRFWALVVITAIYDRKGKLTGFGKVTRDLTERREVEEQLRAKEEQFRLLVDRVEEYAIFMVVCRSGRVLCLGLYRHQFHSAFRTIAWLVCNDLGMHETGVFSFGVRRVRSFACLLRMAGDGH